MKYRIAVERRNRISPTLVLLATETTEEEKDVSPPDYCLSERIFWSPEDAVDFLRRKVGKLPPGEARSVVEHYLLTTSLEVNRNILDRV